MKALVSLVFGMLVLASGALAQSPCPPIVFGAVLTPAQWQQCFTMKADVGTAGGAATFPYTPLNKAGDSMLGELFSAPSLAASAPFNIPPGAAPSSPKNGDFWMTAAGLFVRVAGVTVGPLGAPSGLGFTPVNKAGDTMTGELVLPASVTGGSGFNIPQGVAPTSPVNGDIWTSTLGLFSRANGVTAGPFIAANQSNIFSKRQTNAVVTLAAASPITPDFSQGNAFALSASGVEVFNFPIGLAAGYFGCIQVINTTGSASLSFTGTGATNYTAPGGVATIVLTPSLNAVDELCAHSYDGTTVRLTIANNFVH